MRKEDVKGDGEGRKGKESVWKGREQGSMPQTIGNWTSLLWVRLRDMVKASSRVLFRG